MFDRRTPAEKAAAAEHQAAVAQAAADEREAARVAATPLGQAVAAKERGDRFFQMQIPISSLECDSSFGEPSSRFRSHGPRGGLLGEIEDLGWHLEHTGFVFIETALVSTNNLVRTGQSAAQRGLLVGVYLFREVAAAVDGPNAAPGPADGTGRLAEPAQTRASGSLERGQPAGAASRVEETAAPDAPAEPRPIEGPPTGGVMTLANPVPPANLLFQTLPATERGSG